MKKADIPPAPRRGHGSSRQTLKQKLDRTPGMRLFHEEERAEKVVHRTSSATQNFFGSLSGLRQLAAKSSRSWLIRDMSVPTDLNGLDTESNASSFGSVNRFGSAADLAGLVGLDDPAGSQSSSSIFFRSQLEIGSRRNSLGGDLTPRHSRRNSLEGCTPRQCDGDDAEQFALDGVVASADRPEERNDADLKKVVLLQALARRMLARKDYHAMVKGASTIQRAWRARQKQQQELRIVKIQCHYRGWKCRKIFKAMVEKVVLLQACARRTLGRNHYQAMVKGALTIQHAWRARQKHRQELEMVAAVRIQSYCRGWKCRKMFKAIVDKVVLLQACARRMLARKQYQSMVTGASTIQHAWRAFSARQKHQQELRIVAVVRIQSYYRGWKCREMFKTVVERVVYIQGCARRMLARKHQQLQAKAASTIQSAWRAYQKHQQELRIVASVRIQSYYRGWSSRKLFKVMVDRVVYMQSCARRMLARKHYQDHLHLQGKRASTIQLAWRAFSARQKLQQELRLVAAVRIQSSYRGWRSRKLFKTMVGRVVNIQACARKMLARKHLQLQVKAALTIQHAWRAFNAQRKHKQELRIVAVVRMQSYYRRWRSRKLFKTMVSRAVYIQACARRMLARKHLQLQVKAASTIQNAWRAFRARQKLEMAAVVRIQSYYRGWQCRRLFSTMVGRVVYIQSCARRMLARRHYQAIVKAASTIQQAWRTYIAEQKHQRNLELVAVVKIQSCYRGWRSRKLLKTMVGRVIIIQACARRMLARKHYQGHLQSLVKAASTIQQAWRAFSARQKHRQELEMVAVVKIQSYYRGWRSRKMFTVMVDRVVHLQSCARRMLARKHYQAMLKGALTIQQAWRARQKHQQELVAVVKIQSCCRGWRSRKMFEAMVGRAVYIQACVRRTLATRQYKKLRRGAIVLQRRWRKFQRLQVEENAALKIQSRWRSYKQHQLYQSLRQHRADCAMKIRRRWRVFQNLRLQKERAVILIQAHFRGRRVRIWLKRTHSAVICIESAYWSYAQRRPKKLSVEQQCHLCEQSTETCAVRSDENCSPPILLKESLCGSNGSLHTFSPKSPLSVANSFVHPNETHNNDCGYMSSQCSVSLMEDWNNVPIDELDQCLDTCLAALPLSAASSRQRSLASSRQCSSTFDVVSSSTFLDQLDVSSTPAPPIERTPAPASFRSSEVEQDWVGVREVYGSAARETIQSGSEISSPLHKVYPSPSRELLVDEESVTMAEQGEKSVTRSPSKDEERLQQFAEIFLTMRQISLQQQRAQCAPPFPPSVAPPRPPQSPPILEAGRVPSRASRYASVSLAPTPASSTDLPRRTDVVLNMEELLKTLEQYCDEESGGCDMVSEGDIESGHNWSVRKTSTPTLGIQHLKLPDVNAVLIVLVAMVVYTRTVCREVFFGTRQSPRKK